MYLVLFTKRVSQSHSHWVRNAKRDGYLGSPKTDESTIGFQTTDFQQFEKKKDAIEFAVENNGVIVEAFNFDIKKVKEDRKD